MLIPFGFSRKDVTRAGCRGAHWSSRRSPCDSGAWSMAPLRRHKHSGAAQPPRLQVFFSQSSFVPPFFYLFYSKNSFLRCSKERMRISKGLLTPPRWRVERTTIWQADAQKFLLLFTFLHTSDFGIHGNFHLCESTEVFTDVQHRLEGTWMIPMEWYTVVSINII